MVEFRGVKVWIESEGNTLEEYKVERTAEDDEHVVNNFIISSVGKNFVVSCENLLDEVIVLQLYMDGTWVDSPLCDPQKTRQLCGAPISQDLYKPYQFGVLDVVDKAPDSRAWNNVGMIEAKIYRVIRVGEAHSNLPSLPKLRTDPAPEKSKKLASHRIILGEAQKGKLSTKTVSTQYIDDKSRPFAVFQFRYRPKDLLQAQGIIPTTSSRTKTSDNGGTLNNEGKRKRSARPENQAGPSRQIRRIDRPTADESQGTSDDIVDDVDGPLSVPTKTEDSEWDEELPQTAIARMQMMERRLKALEARTRRDRRTIQELRSSKEGPETIDLTDD